MVTKIEPKNWDGTVILVADSVREGKPTNEFDRRIDQPLAHTVDFIHAALENRCSQVVRFADLAKFTAAVGKFPNSIVFPYWFGQRSRSRHGLVPAICEAADVMFVGAGAFAKVVCNDKELSKVICRQSQLLTPTSAVLTCVEDIAHATYVPLPIVAKPNYEGTSLGITQRNLCRSWQEVALVSEELFRNLGQPVILEEFVPGREFSACMLGTTSDDTAIRVGAWKIDGDPTYLDDRLNTFDLKLPSEKQFEFESLDNAFSADHLTAFRNCFSKLGKTELLRIDGRINSNGDVTILELTPDIYLGADGEFCNAFGYDQSTYGDFISLLIDNCLKGYEASVPMS